MFSKILMIYLMINLNNTCYADEMFNLGKKIFFGKGNCSSCHVLTNQEDNGGVAQNLNKIKPNMDRIIYTITEGVGVMPSYKDILSFNEIDSLAVYVYESTKK
jgi:mono/diheme cytochrome c family protein